MFTDYLPTRKNIVEKGSELLPLSLLSGSIVWLGRTVSILKAAHALTFLNGALFSAATLFSFALGHRAVKKLEAIPALNAPILTGSLQVLISFGIPIFLVSCTNPLSMSQSLYLAVIAIASRKLLGIGQASFS